MIEYTAFDLALREIGNGIWALTALLLMVVFSRYAWNNWHDRHHETVKGAAALALYFAGSTVRALLGWGATAASRREDWSPDPWATSWPWYVPSLIASVIGAAWVLTVFTPRGYRLYVCLAFWTAVGLPIAFFWFGH
jgi:hypothetical protein